MHRVTQDMRKTDAAAPAGARKRRHRRTSFTLIELMVVMAAIMVLLGITLPVSKYVSQRIKEARQQAQNTEIAAALDQYRSAFGEYPIPGNPVHYSTNYIADPQTNLPSQYFWINLVENPTESLDFAGVQIDHTLTYPLMEGPQERGEPPFMVFPEVAVTYLIYKTPSVVTTEVTKQISKETPVDKTVTTFGLAGTPIVRAKAIAPATGKQWKYESDGKTYTLCATNGAP